MPYPKEKHGIHKEIFNLDDTGKIIYGRQYDGGGNKILSAADDRLKCDICDKLYTRSNMTHHKRTLYHRKIAELKNKLY